MYQMIPAATFWRAAKWEEMCGTCNLFHVLWWFFSCWILALFRMCIPLSDGLAGHVQYVAMWWRTYGVSILPPLLFFAIFLCRDHVVSASHPFFLLIMSFFLACWLAARANISPRPLEVSSHGNWNPQHSSSQFSSIRRKSRLHTRRPRYHLISGLNYQLVKLRVNVFTRQTKLKIPGGFMNIWVKPEFSSY